MNVTSGVFSSNSCLYTGLLIIRGKKTQISRDLQRQIRRENGQFRGNFALILGANFAEKQRRKNPEKKYIGRMSNSGQERKHKSSFNTVLKATVLVSSDKKDISLSFTEMPGQLTSFFSCSLEPNKATQ